MDLRPYRLHLIGAALVLLSLLLILAYLGFSVVAKPKQSSLSSRLSSDFAPRPVSEGLLFPPSEPEIIPRIILSREPKTSWTASDAAPFWTDPRSIDQGPLKSAADESIKRVFDSVR